MLGRLTLKNCWAVARAALAAAIAALIDVSEAFAADEVAFKSLINGNIPAAIEYKPNAVFKSVSVCCDGINAN